MNLVETVIEMNENSHLNPTNDETQMAVFTSLVNNGPSISNHNPESIHASPPVTSTTPDQAIVINVDGDVAISNRERDLMRNRKLLIDLIYIVVTLLRLFLKF